MNIHWNNRCGSSASWEMQSLFIMTADLSLGRWTLRTQPELAAQEIWPKLCGWKLHPTWLPTFTSPIETETTKLWFLWLMEDTVISEIIEQRKNVQINTCKRQPESEGIRGTGRVLSGEELNHLCFSCKYSFYCWTSGFGRSFPASRILWFCELRKYECLPRDGAKA